MTIAHEKDLIEAFTKDPSRAALLLDYDGTLTPIVADPSAASLGETELELLHRLSEELGTLAIVSGRPGEFLREQLGFGTKRRSRLVAYGRGGLDRISPDGDLDKDGSFDGFLPLLSRLADTARAIAPDALVEEKGVVVTLHWRRSPANEPALVEFARDAAATHQLALRPGKGSIELFPANLPTKATIVRSVASEASVIAFIGDDVGDVEAFDALDACADHCQTIRVGVISDEAPQELIERSDLLLCSPEETVELLDDLDRALCAHGQSRAR